MKTALIISLALLAPALFGQGNPHFSEVERYREALPGEWSTTSILAYTPRYINITDVSGFDDSVAPRFLTGMSYFAMRYEVLFDYTIDRQWSIGLRPNTSLGYGYTGYSSHAEFPLQNLSGRLAVPAKFSVDQISFDLGLEAELRRDWIGLLVDYRWQTVIRKRRIRASSPDVTNNNGFVDNLRGQTRNEEDIYQQHAWGVGLAFHIPDQDWNYRGSILYRPATYVDFKGRTGILNGIGLDLRADGLRLSNDIGLALSFRWDFWLPNDDFNDAFFFEFGIGARFS